MKGVEFIPLIALKNSRQIFLHKKQHTAQVIKVDDSLFAYNEDTKGIELVDGQ